MLSICEKIEAILYKKPTSCGFVHFYLWIRARRNYGDVKCCAIMKLFCWLFFFFQFSLGAI